MNINLHIERLILDGLPLEAKDSATLHSAVEVELGRLLSQNTDVSNWQSGGAVPSVRADAIQLKAESSPAQIGRQIAGSIYGGIGKTI
ncbi:MAG TPA: hypothetical protein VF596_21140 [Pyrinomonadaceae bacterium]|jgi:hypothetical protein